MTKNSARAQKVLEQKCLHCLSEVDLEEMTWGAKVLAEQYLSGWRRRLPDKADYEAVFRLVLEGYTGYEAAMQEVGKK